MKRRDMRPIYQYWPEHEAAHYVMPDASHVCSRKLRTGPRWVVIVDMAGVLFMHAEHVVDDFGTLVQVTPWR